MKKYVPLLFVCLSSLCLADSPSETTTAPVVQSETKSFLSMKPDEWTACGLDKLAKEERAALQTWIQHYVADIKSVKEEIVSPVAIKSMKEGAKSIELADGRIYTLSSSARKVALLWNVGDLVKVEAIKKKKNVMLTHVSSNKTIKAKLFVNEMETDSK